MLTVLPCGSLKTGQTPQTTCSTGRAACPTGLGFRVRAGYPVSTKRNPSEILRTCFVSSDVECRSSDYEEIWGSVYDCIKAMLHAGGWQGMGKGIPVVSVV